MGGAHKRREWTGSTVRFELADRGPLACGLDFRHVGLPPDLVAEGWDHFLASLSGYLEHGTGTRLAPDSLITEITHRIEPVSKGCRRAGLHLRVGWGVCHYGWFAPVCGVLA